MSSKVAKRYAKALFHLSDGNPATARQNLPGLEALRTLFATEAGKVLGSPVWPVAVKQELLAYGLKTGGATKEVNELVRSLVAAARVDVIPDLVQEYKLLIDEAEGLVRAELVSAVKLADADIAEISAQVAEILSRKIEVTSKVDPSLLGGFIVKAGTKVIDLSLKTKLDALAQAVAQA